MYPSTHLIINDFIYFQKYYQFILKFTIRNGNARDQKARGSDKNMHILK